MCNAISFKIKIYSFLSFPFWPGSGSAFFFADPDRAKNADPCGSETLPQCYRINPKGKERKDKRIKKKGVIMLMLDLDI